MSGPPNTARVMLRAAICARLDAIENAVEMSNARLAGLADTTARRVIAWRRERGLSHPPRFRRGRKVGDVW